MNIFLMAKVKPPIEIEFQLYCSIELKSIKIWPRINSLKSTGFEIFVSSEKTPSEFHKTASHFNLQEDGIQFTNKPSNCNGEFVIKPFFTSTKNLLRKVKNVKIVIKQTTKCVPVLKQIEIWGSVSNFAPKEQQECVQQKLNQQVSSQTGVGSSSKIINKEDSDKVTVIDSDQIDSSSIPDDFLDAITYEIMALPMVLPSGKIVDNSTLQKHTENEEKWGRLASDPFTGCIFTDMKKPILNVHLKSQIDSFLLKNCNVAKVSLLPRTVGSSTLKRRIDCNSESGIDKKFAINMGLKRPHPHECSIVKSISSSSSSSWSSSGSSSSLVTQINHQTLDEAVQKVLRVNKYTTSASNKDNQSPEKCSQCFGINSNILYTITTCSHFICRNCLINKRMNVCSCGNSFSNIDVNKYHNRNIL